MVIVEQLRTCKKCGCEKPIEEFRLKNAAGKPPYRLHTCYVCIASEARENYRNNPLRRATQVVSSMNYNKRNKGQRVEPKAAINLLLEATECAYCGYPNDGSIVFSLDHVIPIAAGGENIIENLAPCCVVCNYAKGDMSAQEYRAWLTGVVGRMAHDINCFSGKVV